MNPGRSAPDGSAAGSDLLSLESGLDLPRRRRALLDHLVVAIGPVLLFLAILLLLIASGAFANPR